MKRVPNYYKEFRCIGGQCKDNCCIGWDVYVDDASIKTYEKVQGEFGRKLKENLILDEESYFKMKDDGRCPFLNHKNLCEIFIELGEENLCEICTKHPRFMDDYDGVTEIGIGMSCEVAAHLILNNKDVVTLEETEDGKELHPYFKYRDAMLQMLQNRRESIWSRWIKVLESAEYLQEQINKESEIIYADFLKGNAIRENNVSMEDWNDEVKDSFKQYEYMTDEFPQVLDGGLKRKENEITETLWEQLSVYFIYRHFMKCMFDDNPLEKVKIGLISFLAIYFWSQDTKESVIETARIYSKEMEYSEENLDMLREDILFGGCFGSEELKHVLVASGNL